VSCGMHDPSAADCNLLPPDKRNIHHPAVVGPTCCYQQAQQHHPDFAGSLQYPVQPSDRLEWALTMTVNSY
jgi:hypothetical protein